MPRQHIKNREIGAEGLGKIKISRRSGLQRVDFREQHHRRKSACSQGKRCELGAGGEKTTGLFRRIQDQKRDKIQYHENADHDGNIIIGKDRRPQGEAVQKRLFLAHQTLQPQHDQREQDNAVQPHDVPAVRRHISRQRVENPEKAHAEIIGPAMPAQIPGKAQTRQTDFEHNPVAHKFDNISLGTQHQQPVKGAGQIVGVQRGEIHPHADVPAVQQAAAVGQLVLEFGEKRGVLVVHVRPQKTLLAEGENSPLGEYDNHHNHRHKKCRQQAVGWL